MKRLWALLSIMVITSAFYPAAARSQPPVFETVVRKVFGKNRVVFTHDAEKRMKDNQRVYIYSGEKFIGTGRICSIYSDENYTCEVPEEVYASIDPGDTVSELPPEKFREALKKIRENLVREKSSVSPGDPAENGGFEEPSRSMPQKKPKPESQIAHHDMIREGSKLASRGDSISIQVAEEKYLSALNMAVEEGRDVITPLEALASLYMKFGRCDEAAKLLKNHLPAALADYPSDAWGKAITAMNIQANSLIYKGNYACAELALTTLTAALETETRDEMTGFFIISIFDRLAYLYGEWGKEEKADSYRDRSLRIKDMYNIDRYLREQELRE